MQTVSDLPPPPPLGSLREQGPVALFLDFDGTLVHLAETPEGIVVPERLAARLAQVADQLGGALALISGRAVVDLERHCGPLEIARAGSHGIDRRLANGTALGLAPEPMPAAAADRLRGFASEQGLRLETKPHGSALHYRENPAAEAAGRDFAQSLAAEHGLVVKHGKFVIELVLPGADKGGAVRAFMQEAPFAGCTPIFVGDDVTDEDGMAAAAELGGFGVLVGDWRPTVARHRLADPGTVHDWLGL